jgi:acyl-CoA synthetase (AMP-forming)/AMP-acid ligase II
VGDTLVARLLRAAEHGRDIDGIRVLDRHERGELRTWSEIRDDVARTAGGLIERGLQSGDRVGIILPTCPGFIDTWFGASWLGAVPVALYPPVRLGRLDEYYARTVRMLKTSGARMIITDKRIQRILGPVLQRAAPDLGMHTVDTLASTHPVPAQPSGPDELMMVQFSSGTTSHPKPVALTHRQVLANTEAILDFMPADAPYEHAGVSWLPLYHDMGLIGCIMPAVHRPGPLTLLPPEAFLARPSLWLRSISRYKATVSPAPNFAYALCTERIQDEDLEGCDLSSWRLALNGAEPTSPEVIHRFCDRFKAWGFRAEALTPVYGLSEAALAVTFGSPKRRFQATHFQRDGLSQGEARQAPDGVGLASVGQPLRGFEIQIRAPDGSPASPGSIGRIWVQGPSLMAGYLDGTESPIRDGWLDTGDLGFVHQGELFVTGRTKDVLIIRGRNHAPQDVEIALDPIDGVRNGCAAAVADISEEGERLLVFVEHRPSPPSDLPEQCRSAIRSATGLDPDLVVALAPGTLPRTSSGKIRRGETLRRWRSGEFSPPDAITPWFLAGALARSAWARLRHSQND